MGRIKSLLPSAGGVSPFFQHLKGRAWVKTEGVSALRLRSNPPATLLSAVAEDDGKSLIVTTSEAFTGDPSETWTISLEGLGDYVGIGEEYVDPGEEPEVSLVAKIKITFEDVDLTLHNEMTATLGYENTGALTGAVSGTLFADVTSLAIDVSACDAPPESPPPTPGSWSTWVYGSTVGTTINMSRNITATSFETFTVTRNGEADPGWTFLLGNADNKIRGNPPSPINTKDVITVDFTNTGSLRGLDDDVAVEDFSDLALDVSAAPIAPAYVESVVAAADGFSVVVTFDEDVFITGSPTGSITIGAVIKPASVSQVDGSDTITLTLDTWADQILSSDTVTIDFSGTGVTNTGGVSCTALDDEEVDVTGAPAAVTRFVTDFAEDSGAYSGDFDRGDASVSAAYVSESTPILTSDVLLRFSASTGTPYAMDAYLSPLMPASGEDFEILALTRQDDLTIARIGVVNGSGTIGLLTEFALLNSYIAGSDFVERLTGTKVSSTSSVLIPPEEYPDHDGVWRWKRMRQTGGTITAWTWKIGDPEPETPTHTRTYTPTDAVNGLGVYGRARSDTTQSDVAYFAACVGETGIPVPLVELDMLMPAAAYAYLDDDWEPEEITLNLRPDIAGGLDRDYPFTWHGDDEDQPGSAEQHVLFDVYDSKPGSDIVADIVARNSTGYDCIIPIHHVSQQNQLWIQSFAAPLSNCLVATSDPIAHNIAPQHFVYSAGTTVLNNSANLAAITGSNGTYNTITLGVADASKITVGKHLLWRKAVGTWEEMEYLYCTARNTASSPQTVTVTRGWRGPAYQNGSYAINHTLSGGTYGYLASHFANQGKGTVTNANTLNPTNPTYQWRYQLTPETDAQYLDAAGKRLIDYCALDIATHCKQTSDAAVAAGVPLANSWPDGSYDDADTEYLYTSTNADYNNDGVADWGNDALTPAGTDQYMAGHRARQALIHAYNDVADLRYHLNFGGYPEIAASDDECIGLEAESVLYGAGSKYNYPPNLGILPLGIQLLKWYVRRGHAGPRLTGNYDSCPSYTHPLSRYYTGTTPTVDRYQRMYMAVTWILGAAYGVQHTSDQEPYVPWRDEFSVGPDGVARKISDGHAAVAPYRHWMGAKLAKFVRYNPGTTFDIGNNVMPNPELESVTGWTAVDATLSIETDSGSPTGGNWLKATPTVYSSGTTPSVRRLGYPVTAGVQNTLIVALRASRDRRVQANVANGILGIVNLYVSTEWSYYPFTFVPPGSTASMYLGLQKDRGELHVGHILSFPGNLGVMYQDFENALVLANTSSADVTVTLPENASYHRINGTQRGPSDPSWVNDGSAVTGSVLVPAYDGVILVKDHYLTDL